MRATLGKAVWTVGLSLVCVMPGLFVAQHLRPITSADQKILPRCF